MNRTYPGPVRAPGLGYCKAFCEFFVGGLALMDGTVQDLC